MFWCSMGLNDWNIFIHFKVSRLLYGRQVSKYFISTGAEWLNTQISFNKIQSQVVSSIGVRLCLEKLAKNRDLAR